MRFILLFTGLLLCSAASGGNEASRDALPSASAKRSPAPVAAPAREEPPVARDDRAAQDGGLPGDSGQDYLKRCAAGCNG
jgi:hypothetical protein